MPFIKSFVDKPCKETTPQDSSISIELAVDYQWAAIAPGYIWPAIEVTNQIESIEVATDYP